MALYNNIVKCFFKRNKHILGVSICLITFAWQPLCAASQSQKLLIINSYNESAPWVQNYITQYLGAPDKPCGVGRADANPKLLLNDT